MTNVRIITDISAYLEPEFIAANRITVLPVEIRFGDEQFLIRPGERPTRLLELMAQGPAMKAQVTIPARYFRRAYEKLHRTTEEILVILSSGKLNDAYASAEAATQPFLGRCQINILDSLSASWGLGLLVKAAVEISHQGQPLEEVVRQVRGMLPRIYSAFFVNRLDYLESGGRIDLAQAILGTMLRIKPILLFEEGDILPLEKVRTLPMALEKLGNFVAEFAAPQEVVILRGPLTSADDALIGELIDHLSLVLPDWEFPVIEYDPLLACHVGPDGLGVAVYESL